MAPGFGMGQRHYLSAVGQRGMGVFGDLDGLVLTFGYIECYYNRQGRLCGAEALAAGLRKRGTV